ncbi:MAG: bifunctional 4-hydroxy-2-oxoglutarate aldolase/2-dehydro-3-deoxy-phosphogluconate aldolase [Alphaproteobacteria bacterium]|nr:bifunctional 4-hydroxy-2-oxoglutarate aldolase/2-dehydro-3-deoxy-phosphogluconate aldolase [Alphaproteobacteria bacterium]
MTRKPDAAKLTVDALMAIQPVIPVVTVDRSEDAEPLGAALVGAGLRVIELVMRTEAAAEAIRRMSGIEGAIVGAGTVLSPTDFDVAMKAGARFIVTPGLSSFIVEGARAAGVPILPGVCTATEIMTGLSLGLDRFKFFPAEQAGGPAMLKALHGPFGHVKFCPTGGVTERTAPDYLALPNVAVVGGGWITPKALVDAKDWEKIADLAKTAAGLKR